jgi:hypothetical protein
VRISETLYFAPGIPFSQLALGGEALPEQFGARINGYYLRPAVRAAAAGDGFAAGLLAVVAIDALSRLEFGPNRRRRRVVRDFVLFARHHLPSFQTEGHAALLYDSFRNGLVHEGRLKNGAQFELGRDTTLSLVGGLPVIAPDRLVGEVAAALEGMVNQLRSSVNFRRELTTLLRREFAFELQDAA